MHNWIIVVFGLPGSGKSTVSNMIHKIVGTETSEIISTDAVRKELFPFPIYSLEETKEMFNEFYKRTDHVLKNAKLAILDGVFARQSERDEIRQIASWSWCSLRFIHVFANENVVEKRLAKRTSDTSDADFKVYLKLKALFEDIQGDFINVDNSTEVGDLEVQIRKKLL